MARRADSQLMVDLPSLRSAPFTPPFHFKACDYFGPFKVKIRRNKTKKHYRVILACLNTRAVHLEVAVDCSTMEFMEVLRCFFSIRGYPELMISDNGFQLVGAARHLWYVWRRKRYRVEVYNLSISASKRVHWSTCQKSALKRIIGELALTPLELHKCLLEVANLVDQRPISQLPYDPDIRSSLCPNDILLRPSTPLVPQGPFQDKKNPRRTVEFVQRLVDSFCKRWTGDVFPTLVLRRKWQVGRRNVRVGEEMWWKCRMRMPYGASGPWAGSLTCIRQKAGKLQGEFTTTQ